ncbi:hypothetical protein BHE74_00047991 [Ensete ventricosum]|nr:hypothetical protein GW17_00028554 [Ensete ventricosum]RWW46103.1 hypothetical protein BHE74_00047991 [Ensete ventricosum]RZR92027.1 hypothetical protein BHM03_00020250 [Ensete ventricosum]
MISRSLNDFASTGEDIPEDDDPETLASRPYDYVPSEPAKGTDSTLDEPEEDIQLDQLIERSRGHISKNPSMQDMCEPHPHDPGSQSLGSCDQTVRTFGKLTKRIYAGEGWWGPGCLGKRMIGHEMARPKPARNDAKLAVHVGAEIRHGPY